MKIAVLGRSEILYGVAESILQNGHEVTSIVSPLESPEYRKTSQDFRTLARLNGIPFSSGGTMGELAEFLVIGEPDIGVSVNFPVVISRQVIGSLPLGILNVHGGDLPRYRGNACQAWAILNGEEKIGLCVHKMEGGKLDSGDIISRDYFPLDISTSITAVHQWIIGRSPSLVLEALIALDADPSFVLEKQSQAMETPLRCFPRRPEDARIDWSRSAVEVVRLIKASSRPYRGAFTYLGNSELAIWDADLFEHSDGFLAVPGSLIVASEMLKVVACGEGAVELKEYSFSGEASPASVRLKSTRQRLS